MSEEKGQNAVEKEEDSAENKDLPETDSSNNQEAQDLSTTADSNSVNSRKRKYQSLPSDVSSDKQEGLGVKRKWGETADHTVKVAEHYNSLEEKGLSQRNQSRIVYMRNFNNWIKSMLINEYVGKIVKDKPHGTYLTALDMCCGKGGDLFKWKKLNVHHVLCADIAEVSIQQCEQRYEDMVRRERSSTHIFKAEFIAADCTKIRLREKYKDPSMQIDIASCQFAFHYCFESLPQAECMLKNAGESLKPGGYFIGTMPDAYEIVSRWQKSKQSGFGNEVYSIKFPSEDKSDIPLFGAKYDFHLEEVVDCPEFLVHLPTLRKLALKFGLKLVMFERFDKYFQKTKDQGKFLLEKMQALEIYPPMEGTSLVGDPATNYNHAKEYMKDAPHYKKIGTLSNAEWDATTLYAVFAFQKMEQTWNSDGTPKYV